LVKLLVVFVNVKLDVIVFVKFDVDLLLLNILKFGDLGADLLNGDIPLVNLLNGLSFLSLIDDLLILLLLILLILLSFLTSDNYLLKLIDSVIFFDSFLLISLIYFD